MEIVLNTSVRKGKHDRKEPQMDQILCTRRIILSTNFLLIYSWHGIIALFYLWFLLYEPFTISLYRTCMNGIGSVMVIVIASSVVDGGFDHRSGQTKDHEIGMCCFSAKHAALRKKSKYWFVRNQNNVSEWTDMSTHWLLVQWTSTIKSNSACWSSTKRTSSSSHWSLTCSRHDIDEKLLNSR
jgi:hypothetical protein